MRTSSAKNLPGLITYGPISVNVEMNFKQFLTENNTVPEYLKRGDFEMRERNKALHKYMESIGYQFLGSGVEKVAYVNKRTHKTKIIIYVEDFSALNTFKRWIDFCQLRENDPHLPNVKLDKPLNIVDESGEKYKFQVASIERLFSLEGTSVCLIGTSLEEISYQCQRVLESYNAERTKEELVSDVRSRLEKFSNSGELEDDAYSLLILSVEDVDALIGTLLDVVKFMPDHTILDLHPGNFMFGEDGTIVITDPWIF